MLLADALIQLRHLIDDGAIKHLEETQIVGLIRLLRQLVTDGGPLPQLAPTISGGIEVQWLVGADFVGLIVDRAGGWLLWTESSAGGFEIEGGPGELVPPNRLVELHNQMRLMGRSARVWVGPAL